MSARRQSLAAESLLARETASLYSALIRLNRKEMGRGWEMGGRGWEMEGGGGRGREGGREEQLCVLCHWCTVSPDVDASGNYVRM